MTTQAVALVSAVYDLRKIEGNYVLTVEICIPTEEESSLRFSVNASSASLNPLLPNWRTKIAAAAEYAALNDYDIEITQILFSDLNVLGL